MRDSQAEGQSPGMRCGRGLGSQGEGARAQSTLGDVLTAVDAVPSSRRPRPHILSNVPSWAWDLPQCGPCPSLPSAPNLEVQLVEGRWQVLGHMAQEVARQNEDLDVARAIEHVVWQPGISQLVVVQVYRPGNEAQVLTHPDPQLWPQHQPTWPPNLA